MPQGDVTFLISQDPCQQRARRGRNENPCMQQCLHNAAAIRVQKSLATDPVCVNCGRKRRLNGSPKLTILPAQAKEVLAIKTLTLLLMAKKLLHYCNLELTLQMYK